MEGDNPTQTPSDGSQWGDSSSETNRLLKNESLFAIIEKPTEYIDFLNYKSPNEYSCGT